MADDWLDDFADFFEPDPPNYQDILFGNELEVDQRAQDLFTEAFFNSNEAAYVDLIDYMWSQYGINFEDVFEWEDFRDWYEGSR